ncbi:YHS domain-containing (seleno)protein [Fluviicola chungangensis]|uniref:YHS domain protein n=1 Tax=Fluviicola chungangensis TaxID=2597671 RepID=A0A556N5S5_9FLAO|nr:YHS domain-containing (seleno)protein [Fluviicola chungangensis]TSJ47552.1 YHS domain protein [Fluviicola chungangensis]
MKALLFTALILLGNHSIAQSSNRKSQFNLEHGLAIQGYDPVSYFNGKPLPGKKEYSFIFEEVTYRFASIENKRAFEKNPKKYEPQYGGWCAYAMGNNGTKVEVNPKTYKITDNKLYLFYDFYFTNTLEDWNLKEKMLKNKADANWATFYKEKP